MSLGAFQTPHRRRAVIVVTAALATAPAAPARAHGPTVDAGRVEARFAAAPFEDPRPDGIDAAVGARQSDPRLGGALGIAGRIGAKAAAWDAILDRERRTTREAPSGVGAAGIDAQRAWIAHRDAACALAHAPWQGGAVRSIVASDRVPRFTAAGATAPRDMRGEGR